MNGCLLLVCCLGGAGAAAAGERLRVGDRERSYALTQQLAPRALVIVLHGGGGSAAQVRASFGMDEVARRENLSIAYPDGIRRHWNDGRGDFSVHGGETPPDDVAFLSELARRLARDSGNTPVFVAGVSNGGMMAYRLACDTDNLFAGFAAVIANLSAALAKTCAPKTPRPMLIMNGTTDPLTPYHGGSIVFFGQNRGDVISAPDTFERWLRWTR